MLAWLNPMGCLAPWSHLYSMVLLHPKSILLFHEDLPFQSLASYPGRLAKSLSYGKQCTMINHYVI